MIKGIYRSLGYGFPDDFRDFMSLVNRASVTFKDAEIDTEEPYDEDKKEFDERPGTDIRFNLMRGALAYKRLLDTAYERGSAGVEEELAEVFYKSEKLTLLARYITHIESCQMLLTKNADKYQHRLFSFSNLSKDSAQKTVNLGQEDFQEYFFWMDHYLIKMHSLLIHLQSSTQRTAQEEFAKPSNIAPRPDVSSIENPISFFWDIVERNGVRKLRNRFKPSEDDYHYYPDVSYNEETEIKTINEQDNETGEWETNIKAFSEEYLQKVYTEFNKTRNYIDLKIDTCKTTDEVRLSISLLTARLRYLLSKIPENKDAAKYNTTERSIKGLLRFVYEKYGGFAPPEDETIKAILDKKDQTQEPPRQLLAPVNNGVQVFSLMGGNADRFAILLHKGLIDARLIDPQTEVFKIRNAFDGTFQEHPLKIRWIDKGRNQQINKKTLIYLLDELAKAKLISEDGDNPAFLQRIGFVFADAAGDAIRNLKESSATKRGKKTVSASIKAIDDLIVLLKR